MGAGCILNVNYRVWRDKSDQVGWPHPTPEQPLWAYQRIARGCPEYRQAGFTAVMLPPSTEGGSVIFSDVYENKDDYSIYNTAFGSGEMLRQCVASIRAHGMQAYGDLVLHQYGGGSADGVYATKRFPKHASCFVGAPPRVPVDPVPDMMGNFPFGDMAGFVYSTPKGYMHDGIIAAVQWLTRTTGMQGWRVDDCKGTHAGTVYDILQSPAVRDCYAVGEYFDGSPGPVGNWINGYMRRRSAVLDFAFKFNVGNICNNAGRSWMGALSNIGYCNIDPAMSVTFSESADTDNSPGQQIVWNKAMAYAIMLTFPGYPSVYYRDWSTDPDCYGMKDIINNLIYIHDKFANGPFVPRLDNDPQVFVHERTGINGLPGCLCGFNNDPWHMRTVTVQTSWPPNTRLHEFTGKYDTDVWTDSQGRATFTLPPNNNGLSYLVFAEWVPPAAFSWRPQPTTQVLYLAGDLPNSAAVPAGTSSVVAGYAWVAKGTQISGSVAFDQAAGGNATDMTVMFKEPSGARVSNGQVKEGGRIAVIVQAESVAAGGMPAEVTVTYTGE